MISRPLAVLSAVAGWHMTILFRTVFFITVLFIPHISFFPTPPDFSQWSGLDNYSSQFNLNDVELVNGTEYHVMTTDPNGIIGCDEDISIIRHGYYWNGTQWNDNFVGTGASGCGGNEYFHYDFFRYNTDDISSSTSRYLINTYETGATGASEVVAFSVLYWNASTQSFSNVSVVDVLGGDLDTGFSDMTLSSTTNELDFSIDYFLDQNEIDTSISSKNPQNITFAISSSTLPIQYPYLIDSTAQGSQTRNGSYPDYLPDGDYTATAFFSNTSCANYESDILGENPCPFLGTRISQDFTLSGGLITSTSTIENYRNQVSFFNSADLENTKYYECSFNRLDGCLKNVMVFLFVPADFSTATLKSTFDTLLTKMPFSYLSDLRDIITDTSNSATPDSFPTVDFSVFGTSVTIMSQASLDAIYATSTRTEIRSISGYIIYILTAVAVLFLVLNLFSRQKFGESHDVDTGHKS